MNTLKIAVSALFIAVLAGCASAPTTTDAAPDADGTLVVREAQVLRIQTGGAGEGTMTLRGWEYPFEINNMVFGGVGPGRLQLEGDIYNIDEPGDLEGTFTLQSAQVEAGKGAEGYWLENENGVRVLVRPEGQDVTVRLDGTGSVVTLK